MINNRSPEVFQSGKFGPFSVSILLFFEFAPNHLVAIFFFLFNSLFFQPILKPELSLVYHRFPVLMRQLTGYFITRSPGVKIARSPHPGSARSAHNLTLHFIFGVDTLHR